MAGLQEPINLHVWQESSSEDESSPESSEDCSSPFSPTNNTPTNNNSSYLFEPPPLSLNDDEADYATSEPNPAPAPSFTFSWLGRRVRITSGELRGCTGTVIAFKDGHFEVRADLDWGGDQLQGSQVEHIVDKEPHEIEMLSTPLASSCSSLLRHELPRPPRLPLKAPKHKELIGRCLPHPNPIASPTFYSPLS